MSRRKTIAEAEERVGMSLGAYFAQASDQKLQLADMCAALGASEPTVSYWLDANGYEYEGRWVKREEAA